LVFRKFQFSQPKIRLLFTKGFTDMHLWSPLLNLA